MSNKLKKYASELEQQREMLKLKAVLKSAEEARLAGTPAYTLEESQKRLEAIYDQG